MKYNKILETAAKAFAGVKLGGKKSDPQLADLDRGVLTVGFLVAALDGTILPEEYAALSTLAKKCRGGSAKNVRALVDAALPTAGQLVTMAQVGVYSEQDRLEAFLAAAMKALPRGFANGSLADLRRAFALWVAIAVADGVFSAVEKAAIAMLGLHYAAVRTKKAKKGAAKAYCLMEADFLTKAEKIARDLAVPAKKEKAEAALEALIASVPVVGGKGKAEFRPASGIAVRLLVMAMLGLIGADAVKAADVSGRGCRNSPHVADDDIELQQTEVLNCGQWPCLGATPKLQQFVTPIKADNTKDGAIEIWFDQMANASMHSSWAKQLAGQRFNPASPRMVDDLGGEDWWIRGCMNGQKITKA